MSDIFSTREIATGIYFLLFSLIFSFVPDVRKGVGRVLKTALSPVLIKTTLFYCSLGLLLTLLLSKLPYWKNIYIKDIIMWMLLVGIPFCYGAITRRNTEGYYKAAILSNVRYTVFFECFFSTFTFELWIELLLIAVISFISLLDYVAKREERFARVAKLTHNLLVYSGVLLLCFTIREAVEQMTINTSYDMLASLVIPLIFSLFYVPFAYLLELTVQYRNAFMRIGFVKGESWWTKKWHCAKVVFACGLSSKKVKQFMNNLIKSNYRYSSEKEFNRFLQ